jgi:superoxide reductase
MAEFSLDEINKASDEANMTDLEKKHTPVIHVPDRVRAGEPFEVAVNVGELLAHPNELAHYITRVELYTEEYIMLGRAHMTPIRSVPRVKFTVVLDKSQTLRAYSDCNIHGTWQGKKEVVVK